MKAAAIPVWMVAAFACLTACAPMYVPNRVNTPLLSHAGELQVGGFVGTSGFDPQLSYAFTHHFGMMANGSFQFEPKDPAGSYNRHSFAELGIGYLHRLSQSGRFEVFGGYGLGAVEARYANSLFTDYAKAQYQRFFLQPDIGFSTRAFDGGLALRLVVVRATQHGITLTNTFLEPAVTLKTGFKYLKLVGQFGLTLPLGQEELIEPQPFNASIGIQAYINKGYSK